MSQFFGSSFYVETRRLSESLEPLIGLLAYLDSGAKIMPQKTKSGQNFYPHKRKPGQNNTPFVYGHNSPPE